MTRTTISPRRAQTRSRLLTAAGEIFVERGIAGASVEDICERAGFTRGAFYSNFADRDELVLALVAQQTDRIQERLRELVARHSTSDELLAAAGEAWTFGLPGNGRVLALEITLHALRTPEVGRVWVAQQRSFRAGLTEILGDWFDAAGRSMPMDTERLVRLLQAVFLGEIGQSILEPDVVTPESLQQTFAALVLDQAPGRGAANPRPLPRADSGQEPVPDLPA